jgi:hypothetical protein
VPTLFNIDIQYRPLTRATRRVANPNLAGVFRNMYRRAVRRISSERGPNCIHAGSLHRGTVVAPLSID